MDAIGPLGVFEALALNHKCCVGLAYMCTITVSFSATSSRATSDKQHTAFQIMHQDPEPMASIRDGIAPALAWLVQCAMGKSAGYRFQSAARMAQANEELADTLWPGSRPARQRAPVAPAITRRRRPAAVAVDLSCIEVFDSSSRIDGVVAAAGHCADNRRVRLFCSCVSVRWLVR